MRTPILETERLILRPLKVEDAQEVFDNWASDPEVAKFMVWSTHENVDVTKVWLAELEKTIDSDEYDWGFVRKADGKLIGSGGIYYKENADSYNMGYNIMKDCWHQGYTTEAVRTMIDFGIKVLNAKRFTASHAKDNPNSGKVMEKVGLHYTHAGQYSKIDGSEQFECKFYELEI